MCLLVALFQTHPEAPLVVAANRDEFLARPATAMAVLSAEGPRILGGRDEVAGGTWLAVNEHGVFAGLTNVPGARDVSKRSRGELPLILAKHETAAAAVEAFERTVRPADFSPAWILVGDRTRLFYVDMASGGFVPGITPLSPGVHVLENAPLFAPSPKAKMVTVALQGIEPARGDALIARLKDVLRSHEVPATANSNSNANSISNLTAPDPAPAFIRPRETFAPCVHAGPYGTRSSLILTVRAETARAPDVLSADGPPCTAPFVDVTNCWVRR